MMGKHDLLSNGSGDEYFNSLGDESQNQCVLSYVNHIMACVLDLVQNNEVSPIINNLKVISCI